MNSNLVLAGAFRPDLRRQADACDLPFSTHETRPFVHEGGLMNSNLSFNGRVSPSQRRWQVDGTSTCTFPNETRPRFHEA